jgi:YHS domain-containing protein
VTDAKCTDTSTPVLGGVDVVNYFTSYKLSSGGYNDTQPGIVGLSKYSSIFNGYTFYFSTSVNKKIFDSYPSKYLPQYGGFCTWGISTEVCPKAPWSTTCIGPYGNWNHWVIVNEKLYFFWFDQAKTNFLTQGIVSEYIKTADARWEEWYGDKKQSVFSTNCYVSTVGDVPGSH